MSINAILRRELTDEQYAAATDTAEEILCIACAGSGKSRTLAYRIAKLISDGNSPESIVAFTFTEKAADSIKRRVASALVNCGLQSEIVGAIYIGTIHSYCQYLLGEMDAKYRQFEVLDENRLKLYLLSRYPQLGIQNIKAATGIGQFAAINEVANAWKIANDEMVDFDELETADAVLGKALKTLYTKLNTDQYIDFSLMIRLVVEALQSNNQSINNVLSKVSHLLVDEYQDVNPSQEALIGGIYNRVQSLFVVGDDDQAIYGWRGADVRNIINFDQRYPDCSRHTLATNFRSTAAIVESADAFIRAELSASRIDKQPLSHSSGNISHFGNLWFDNPADEAEWIADRINDLIGVKIVDNGVSRGLTRADFAILMRSVTGGAQHGGSPRHSPYTQALTNANISYIIEAEGSIFSRPYATTLRDTMELLRNSGPSRESVRQLFDNSIITVFPNANFNKLTSVISEWNNLIHTPLGGARRRVYPQELVLELLNAFGVQEANLDEGAMRDLGVFSSIILDVEKVFVSIDDAWRFTNILNFLQNVAETGYDVTQINLLSKPDAVTISTIHKMKGLEFPVVFLVDVVQQRFPTKNSSYTGILPISIIQNAINNNLYCNDVYGEARLFYTALTRAERFLYVTGSSTHPGLSRPKKPSRFKLRLAHSEMTTDPDHLPHGIEKVPQIRRIDDDSMPTSFTEIKDFLECPMKYKFRKIYGFSPAVPELFGFGLTTHAAINKLHQNFPMSRPRKEDGENAVEEIFHLKHVFPSKDPDRRGPYENAKQKSKEIVGRYAADYPEDFVQNRQLEQAFEIKAGNAVITGAIDLLLKEDNNGNILEAKVIDYKSMDYPEDENIHFWINLSLQVQLYAHAAQVVLGENAKTGAVHLLKASSKNGLPNRVDVPIDSEALNAAISNIEWAVERILDQDFPHRPSRTKCESCDFKLICSKMPEDFQTAILPPPIKIPQISGVDSVMVAAFSDFEAGQLL